MATIALPKEATRHRAPAVHRDRREFYPPAHAFCELPDPNSLPKDDLGREIAVLLFENPEIAGGYASDNLDSLSAEDKRALLSEIRGALGIRPFRRKNLGYVGPRPKQTSR